jgi:ubiquinone/menaquinone biosynthesis C-methylase UbiE
MPIEAEAQRQLVLDQFTRQAIPFSQMPAHSQESANRLVFEAAGVSPDDRVLDVACGPGIVACLLARETAHVTGLDLTPAMIEQAQNRQAELGLSNVDWQVGEALPLPFPDEEFSLVFTRYSFHHFLDPMAVLREMVRVCRPGGRVVVVDVFASSPEQRSAYDAVEKLRDPSHVRALLLEELKEGFGDAGCDLVRTEFYQLEVVLEELLAASFPNPGDADRVRETFADDLQTNRLGVNSRMVDGRIRFAFPIVVMVGCRNSG